MRGWPWTLRSGAGSRLPVRPYRAWRLRSPHLSRVKSIVYAHFNPLHCRGWSCSRAAALSPRLHVAVCLCVALTLWPPPRAAVNQHPVAEMKFAVAVAAILVVGAVAQETPYTVTVTQQGNLTIPANSWSFTSTDGQPWSGGTQLVCDLQGKALKVINAGTIKYQFWQEYEQHFIAQDSQPYFKCGECIGCAADPPSTRGLPVQGGLRAARLHPTPHLADAFAG